MVWALRVIILLAILGLETSAVASDFEVSVADAVNIPLCGPIGPSPASGTWENNTTGTGSSAASAFSSANGLGGNASATSTGGGAQNNVNKSCFQATALLDDVIISGPASEVSVQVSAIADGWITTVGVYSGDGFAHWRATLKIGVFSGSQTVFLNTQLVDESFGSGTDTAVGPT